MPWARSLILGGAMALLCAGSAVVAYAAPAAAASPTPPRHELRSFVCQPALDPPARAVSTEAVMRPVPGTVKMQMRVDLLRRLEPGGAFELVRGRLLGSWISPQDPTLGQQSGDVWIVSHPVVDLSAPAAYRFRVRFRWLGAHGRRLGSAVDSSPICSQPELRADLLVRSLSVTSLPGGNDAYVAVIANRGQTAAGPVEVDLAGAGAGGPQTASIESVGARSSERHRFVAPPCTPGQPLTVTVDPSRTVDEYDFANNTLTVPCPAPAGG